MVLFLCLSCEYIINQTKFFLMFYEKITPLLAQECAKLFVDKYGKEYTWRQFRSHITEYFELFYDIEDIGLRLAVNDQFTKELWSNLESMGFEFEFEER